MKRKSTKYVSIVLMVVLVITMLAGCGGNDESSEGEAKELKFAFQYGLQYLPAKVVKEQKLIEKHYDGEVTIDWQTLNSGAAVNESMIAGSIDGGMVGTSVAVTGINTDVPYKIMSGLSNIGNRLITNDSSIKTMEDLKGNGEIALVNTGSIQHITLAMAAKKVLGDAHVLDKQIVGMSHPDGMSALQAGSVKSQVTTVPYYNQELESKKNHEITEYAENAAPGASIIVTVMSTKLYEEDPDLYNAVLKAFEEANEYVNNKDNFEAIAEDMYEDEGVTKEQMLEYLNSDDVVFDTALTGLMEFASFMDEEGFIDDKASTEQSDYVFDGATVKTID